MRIEMKALRRRNPQEKKALAYRKDHVVEAEYPHAFRRNWPRKKARSHRAYRRRVRQLLDRVHAVAVEDADERDDVQAEAVRREQVRKGGVVTLRVRVEHIQERQYPHHGMELLQEPLQPCAASRAIRRVPHLGHGKRNALPARRRIFLRGAA